MDEVSGQGMPLGKFGEEKANTSSVILANARMPPSPTGEGLEFAFGAGMPYPKLCFCVRNADELPLPSLNLVHNYQNLLDKLRVRVLLYNKYVRACTEER